MDEQKIRDIVRSEMQNQRYGLNQTTYHTHKGGIGGPRINEADIVPGLRTLGTLTMATEGGIYTFNTGFQPKTIIFTGTPYHKTGSVFDIHTFVYGYAALGQNLPFQPAPGLSVIAGGKRELIQGSTCFYASGSGNTTSFAATNDENHIINVNDGSNDVVRATVIGYSSSKIQVQVNTLSPGWKIEGNFYVS